MAGRDGNRQRIGSIGIHRLHRQQARHHGRHLRLVGSAGADNRFFDPSCRQFTKRQAGRRALHHRHATRHPKFQRRGGRARDKNLFNRGAVGVMRGDNRGKFGGNGMKTNAVG